MTYDRRTDPPDPAYDDTRVVERETYVERPAAEPYAAPPAGQVNVNADGRRAAYVDPGPGPLYYARRILSLIFGILVVLIGLRILLLLLVANAGNPIVDFVYGVTEPFVAPFRGIFAIDQVTPGNGSVLDVAAVVALIGWLLIYLLLMAILRLGDRDRASAV
jgi:uncharacterized protein YggT (Ycf19 family)